MNINELYDRFEAFDPASLSYENTRRAALRGLADLSKKAAIAALPVGLVGLASRALAQSTSTSVLDALQFALKAEYLEAQFYVTVLNNNSGLTGSLAATIRRIAYDELLHVEAIKATIQALGATPEIPYVGPAASRPAGSSYGIDITGGGGQGTGPFAAALTDVDVFLAIAQAFEDNGVRAYKGQVGNLASLKPVLAAGLAIHSIEARHASMIRTIRTTRGSATKPWITGRDPGIPQPYASAVSPIYGPSFSDPSNYPGEDKDIQAGILIANIAGVSTNQATESFDEPQDSDTVIRFLTGQINASVKFIY